jgi:hypothetical protein
MKKLSGPMGTLWDCDPNKSLWSLMTKAWSTIRDQIGKDKAPLDQFFSIICPYLNIPTPEEYLRQLGWNFYVDHNDAPAISRDPYDTQHRSNVGIETAALSVEDIIGYCQTMGYAQQYVPDLNLTSSTFLGHATGTTASVSAMKLSAESTQEKRLAAKKKRRAKRQAAQDAGLAAVFQEQLLHAHILDGFDVPKERNVAFPFDIERDTADEAFYNQLSGALTGQTTDINHCTANHSHSIALGTADHLQNTGINTSDHPQSIALDTSDDDVNMANWSAFRIGADETATLPLFPGLSN